MLEEYEWTRAVSGRTEGRVRAPRAVFYEELKSRMQSKCVDRSRKMAGGALTLA